MDILNHWDQQLRVLTNSQQVWDDRTSASERAPEGTYFYTLFATGVDGQVWELQGSFTLLR